MSLPIAILASGNGTNAQAMIDLMQAGVLDVDIRLVFSNRPNARVLERARAAGLPWKMEDHTKYASREDFDAVMNVNLRGGGVHAGADAVEYGVKLSGCTVHFVDMKVDSGPVIIQAAVPCNAEDSTDDLMNRIHVLEHRIYPQALQWLAEGRVSVQGRHVHIAGADRELAKQPENCLVWPPLEKGF